MFSRWPDKIYMVVNGAVKAGDIAHMQAKLPAAISLHHMTERALLALQGPEAFAALERVTTGRWPLNALTFMMGGPYEIGGVDAFITRSGYTGEDGFEISVDATEVEKVAELLCAQPEVKPIGLGARDSLRLEAGLPLYGHDLDTNTDPVSADLGFAISKRRRTEGGFPGADLILRYLADGAPTKRVGFAVEGRLPAREGAEIFAGDIRVGTITSGGFAPTVGAPIAMGYVEAAYAAPGTSLEIEVRGKRLAATVTLMPFVPHHYVRKGAA
jgi:aminomethyltransferase